MAKRQETQAYTEFTPEKRDKFLAELRKLPNVSRAARIVKVTRATVYKHRDTDTDFAAAWDEALAEGIETLEEAAMQRAKRESDTLMIFLLKAHKPDKYNVPTKNEHTGPDGGAIEHAHRITTVEIIKDMGDG